jgi:hypothetical protein
MIRYVFHRLITVLVALIIAGAAHGQGMQTFSSDQAARQHCPTDTVVWLNTSSANYHFKGDTWYGRTQRGAYTCKTEADKDGVHPISSKGQ